MRLLHTQALQIREVNDCFETPYAIFSHKWGNDEVTFRDVANGEFDLNGAGYIKLQGACRRARQDKYEYIWIDTCCIDKSSSAELSEAINSMFEWYANANVCYAYLSDVFSHSAADADLHTNIKHSSWFTRGWTLQELIAPREVEFFDATWSALCKRSTHADLLSDVTGIDKSVLQGADFRQLSVAKRLFWAANRQTTRVEDRAYSLLGLFDVNMPLLYGEGTRAFVRLQEEIIKSSNDQTIFAWGLKWDTRPKKTLMSILAESPAAFASSADVVSCSTVTNKMTEESHEMTNQGLRMRAAMVRTNFTPLGSVDYVILNCRLGNQPFRRLAMPLLVGHDGRHYRTPDPWGHIPYGDHKNFSNSTIWIDAKNHSRAPRNIHSYKDCVYGIYRPSEDELCRLRSIPSEDQGFRLQEVVPSEAWDTASQVLWKSGAASGLRRQIVMRFLSSRGDDLLVNFTYADGWKDDDLTISTYTWHNPTALNLADLYHYPEELRFELHRNDIVRGFPKIRVRRRRGVLLTYSMSGWESTGHSLKCFWSRRVDILADELSLPHTFNLIKDHTQWFLEDLRFRYSRDVEYVPPLLTFSEREDLIHAADDMYLQLLFGKRSARPGVAPDNRVFHDGVCFIILLGPLIGLLTAHYITGVQRGYWAALALKIARFVHSMCPLAPFVELGISYCRWKLGHAKPKFDTFEAHFMIIPKDEEFQQSYSTSYRMPILFVGSFVLSQYAEIWCEDHSAGGLALSMMATTCVTVVALYYWMRAGEYLLGLEVFHTRNPL